MVILFADISFAITFTKLVQAKFRYTGVCMYMWNTASYCILLLAGNIWEFEAGFVRTFL